ncbi:MAG: GNAT family N-acetyltransferase [Suipraeoptans sp.]
MDVRLLRREEILEALRLTWEVFAQDIAPTYTPQGVEEFQKFIKADNIMSLFDRQGLVFFGAYYDGQLKGTIAVKSIGHISLFYVKKDEQRKGIGRMLFGAAASYCNFVLKVPKLTVNSAPEAVVIYQKLGMIQSAQQQQINGIDFVPMQMQLYNQNGQHEQKKSKTGLIIGIIIGIVILVIAAFAGIGNIVYRTIDQYESRQDQDDDSNNGGQYPNNEYDEDWFDDGDEDEQYQEELEGINAIDAYEADDVSFEIEDDNYQEQTTNGESSYVDFDITYPVINGLENKDVEKKVNETLKNIALKTANDIYLDPTQEMKERDLEADESYKVSYVQYKVTFVNNDFISVVFDDNACKITPDSIKTHLRTANISLKDGKEYKVKDIVDLNNDFLNDFVRTMQLEAQDSKFLTEVDLDTIESALQGKDPTGVYIPEFFLDADGIEIGFDINPEPDSTHTYLYSWVTAPFEMDEIEDYKNNSDFWSYLGDFAD